MIRGRAGRWALASFCVAVVVASGVLADRVHPEEYVPVPARSSALPLRDDSIVFVVEAGGPAIWRTGVLDVFDGESWRLPPFDDKDDGIPPEPDPVRFVGAQTTRVLVRELRGMVLPTPPLSHEIRLEGSPPRETLFFERLDTFRVADGVASRATYKVIHSIPPSGRELRGAANAQVHRLYVRTRGVRVPAALAHPVSSARDETPWRAAVSLRRALSDLRVEGEGLPTPVSAERIDEILESASASPFEWVAILTLALRWSEVPARMGYGFAAGEKVGRSLVFHAKHLSVWTEILLEDFGWMPVPGSIGAVGSYPANQ